ncbi:unnamed protein product [Moneuplotes crassus]|uniref:AP2/ERF domain-containing protein n=1 Tax=Euplotes crassus TaxID=5936 RepID=A0AAD1X8R3_EUPCR|nr:unnamed protein product [Moneuplotes crassus]
MEMYAKDNQTNQAFSSPWGYQQILEYLKMTYCLCQPSGKSFEGHDYCICNNKEKIHRLTTSRSNGAIKCEILQKKCGLLRFGEFGNQSSCNSIKNQIFMNKVESRKHQEETKTTKAVNKRRSRSTRLDIREKLINLQRLITEGKILQFFSKVKKTRYTSDKYLGRRSKYIGVSKNNTHWQALINVNHAKKYIGTFIDEEEAARTYDLYSAAMQDKKAFLNFSYTASEMMQMITYFLANGSIKPQE